jgi:Abnormal spindle-like microcephaly-assoc'd, ASPM-SPD-2-Hydin/Fibronectin type III domain
MRIRTEATRPEYLFSVGGRLNRSTIPGVCLLFITVLSSAGRVGTAVPPTLIANVPGWKAVSFSVGFQPTVADAAGTVLIRSDAVTAGIEAPASGAGPAAEIYLTASPTEVNFGTVNVGEAKTSAITLKASGNADVEILHIIVSGRGFHVTGAIDGTRLAPGAELTLEATFEPPKTGTAGGSVAISSNASPSVIQVGFAGLGVANSTTTSSVHLQWNPSSSSGIAGYYVYRSTSQTGVFQKLNESPEASTSYTDTSVSPGTTYYYKVTSVDSDEIESSFSETVSATIP